MTQNANGLIPKGLQNEKETTTKDTSFDCDKWTQGPPGIGPDPEKCYSICIINFLAHFCSADFPTGSSRLQHHVSEYVARPFQSLGRSLQCKPGAV